MIEPKRTSVRELLLYACFVIGALFLLLQIKSPANLYDEGLVLVNAERIRAGEIPYRDFWTLYAPGYFYALAGLFSLVEPNILAARLFDTALRFLLTLEVYALARSMTSRWVALIPYAFVTFWLATIRFYSYPAFPATAAILLTVLTLIPYLRGGRPRWLFLAGMALGLTALLRLDFGGYAALGCGMALACHELRQARDRVAAVSGWPSAVSLLRAELLLAAGALLVALPLYGYLVLSAGFSTVYEDLVRFPATVFRAVRHLPVPPPLPDFGTMTGAQWNDWLRLYLPLATYAAAFVVALRWLFWRPAPDGDRRRWLAVVLLALTGAGLGLVVKATSRYHELHALPTTICAALVATALAYWLPRRLWRSTPFRVAFFGLAFLLLTGPYIAHFTALAARNAVSPLGCYSQDPKAGCVPVGQDQARVADYIRLHTDPDEYVFFGNARHDLIFVNDLLVQFLSDRRSPTKYPELHPGLATTLPVQHAIARELADKDVRWVVTMRGWESREPNASSISSGVTFLDDYIRQHYQSDASIGSYQVWYKR
jgi:hypothetical protein